MIRGCTGRLAGFALAALAAVLPVSASVAEEIPVHGAHAEPAPRAVSLDEALATARTSSPDVAVAEQRIVAARAAITESRAGLLPSLGVGQSYVASNNPVQAFMMTLNQRAFDFQNADFNHPGTVDNFNTQILGRWRIYDGGRDIADLGAAKLAAEAAEARLAAVRDMLVFEVTRAYYETLKARRFVTTADAVVADRESSLALAENLRDEGAALETDALDAEVALAAARADRIQAASALAIAEAIFTSLVGAGERLTAAEPAGGLHEQPDELPHALDYRRRPELIAARKRVEEAEKRVRAAQAGWLPRLSAFGGYYLDSGDFDDFVDSWAAGASIELDLFDGLRTKGAVERARAEYSTAQAELHRTELQMELDWRRALQGVQESTARLSATAKAERQAERSLAITRERYRGGLALFSRVLSAETALADARQRRTSAVLDYRVALAALERAGGGSLAAPQGAPAATTTQEETR